MSNLHPKDTYIILIKKRVHSFCSLCNGGDDDDNDDNKKDYAFQIESDGGPSADPESVDGTVFAGESNIERNNGKDFDIKDVFNDCQVGMFND